VRLAVAEVIGPGSFQVVVHHREITGLGRGLDETGVLDPVARENTIRALKEFAREMAAHGVMRGQGVATQAVRRAPNGPEFLQEAAKVLRLPVRLLSPEEEARLTLAGVLSALDPTYLEADPLMVFDVGGGSSEFVLLRPGREPVFAGLPLGVLSLSQARPLGDPPEPGQVAALRQELQGELQNFYRKNFSGLIQNTPTLVGTAGSVTTLAAMAQEMTDYDPRRVNNYLLTKDQVAELAERMAGLTEVERAKLPGLEPAKAGVMVAGALIVQTILEVCGQDRLIAIDSGLLEGVLAKVAEG